MVRLARLCEARSPLVRLLEPYHTFGILSIPWMHFVCFCCAVGIPYTHSSAFFLVLCLICPISLIPCRIPLHLYNGLFPRYCLFGCRYSLRFHCFQPCFQRSFPLPVLLQCRVCIFFWLLVLVCRQSYHYHAHVARGVHISY